MQSCNCCMFEGNVAALQRLAELNPLCMEAEEGGSGTERTAGKRTTAGGGKSVQGAERLGGTWAMEANPAWIAKRLERLDRIKAKNAAAIAALEKPAITVTLPDGKQMPGVAWETTPLDIAGALSKGLMQAVCVSSVRYSNRLKGVTEIIEMATSPDDDVPAVAETLWETWDASRPLEGDCELQLLKFDDPRGKEVFWHSTAHMLGQVCAEGGGRRKEGGGRRVGSGGRRAEGIEVEAHRLDAAVERGRGLGCCTPGTPCTPAPLHPCTPACALHARCMCAACVLHAPRMHAAGARDRVLCAADPRSAARERLLLRLLPGRRLLLREHEGHCREEGGPDPLTPTLALTPTQTPTPTLPQPGPSLRSYPNL